MTLFGRCFPHHGPGIMQCGQPRASVLYRRSLISTTKQLTKRCWISTNQARHAPQCTSLGRILFHIVVWSCIVCVGSLFSHKCCLIRLIHECRTRIFPSGEKYQTIYPDPSKHTSCSISLGPVATEVGVRRKYAGLAGGWRVFKASVTSMCR